MLCGISLVALSLSSIAATPDPFAIYMYRGADREQRLLEGARKEGVLMLYTSINTRDSIPITDALPRNMASKSRCGERVARKSCNEP